MTRKREEREILEKFIASGELKGLWEIELPIPSKKLLDKYKDCSAWVHKIAAVHNFRIDAVCDLDDCIWIIEAKKSMNCSALGQLLCYRELYAQWKGIPLEKLRMGLVCAREEPTLKFIYDKHGIKVWCVKHDSSTSSNKSKSKRA